MDCKTARLLLDVAHPRGAELEGDEADLLERHLAECAECGPHARAERRLDAHLGAAVCDVPVPAELRDRILGGLRADRAARVRRRGLRYAGRLAAAAVILLVVGVWWWTRPLPAPNLEQLHFE